MSLYVIGDLHLSETTHKEMDIFGGKWVGYRDKILDSLAVLKDEDTLIVAGDLSWGIDLDEALADFKFLNRFKGQKLLLKGNHDLWWSTVSKMKAFFAENNIQNINFLQNNSYMYNNVALCGTRGWMFESEKITEHDKKVLKREAMRLELSLSDAVKNGADKIYCFMHYPPVYGNRKCDEIMELLQKYRVEKCFYGHLHGSAHTLARQGIINGIDFRLISADFIGFRPFEIKFV